MDSPETHINETVTFHDTAAPTEAVAPIPIDETYAISGDGDVDLGSFLARPVRIQTYEWIPTSPLTHNFNPWADFLSNELVVDKWRHFSYLKGNLHLKMVINGSPFYYGRAIVGYLPLDQDNEPWNQLNANAISNERRSDECRVNYLSQCQSTYLDPSTSSSVEMTLPFICPRNALRLFATGTNASSTNFTDLKDPQQMGRIHIHEMNPLRQGNTPQAGVEAKVTVTIFAWMENAELSVPTDQRVSVPSTFALRPQGKRTKMNMMTGKKEAYEATEGKVSVSSVASAFEGSLLQLGNVPIIGQFATAGSIAAGAVSRVAKIFGFSSPVQLGDTQYFQPEPVPKLASTVGAYLGAKLSVDPLNEVVVDPRVGNCNPQDELSIEHIAAQESFLTSFEYNSSGGFSGTNSLFRCAITPALYTITRLTDQGAGFSGRLMQPTSMAFAAAPFIYWRGTLKVRFQVVASQFHRGRIAVVYEPNINRQDPFLARSAIEYNGRKIQIFDLQEFDGVEIDFPWAQSEMFCAVPSVNDLENAITTNQAYTPSYNNPGGYVMNTAINRIFSNGYFEVLVVNDLTGSIPEPPPVDINVFVSMPDLMVACPEDTSVGERSIYTSSFALKPESENVTGSFEHGDGHSSSMLPSSPTDQIFAINFGENIRSFRSLMRRYQGQLVFMDDTAGRHFAVTFPMYPQYSRYTLPSLPTSSLGYRVGNDLFQYLRGAFVGMRGGFRYTCWAQVGTQYVESYYATRFAGNEPNISVKHDYTINQPNSRGVHVALHSSNPSISFELPYYDMSRFVSAQGVRMKGLDIYPEKGYLQSGRIGTFRNPAGESEFVIAGVPADDFSFIGRVGAPPVIRRWQT